MSEQEEYVVDEQTAEKEFDRFGNLMDLDFDTPAMNEEDAQNFNQQKGVFIRAVRRGLLSVDDEGQPVYELSGSVNGIDKITFYEPTGADFRQQDKRKKNEMTARMHTIMASFTKTPEQVYAKMKNRDLKVCQAITTLFMA